MTETLAELRYEFQRERQRIIELYERATGFSFNDNSVDPVESYYLKKLVNKK